MTDYKINLAKKLTSTPQQRSKLYDGMLIYLAVCAVLMVYAAYLTSRNVVKALQDGVKRRALIQSVSSADAFIGGFYRNPEASYRELERYADDVNTIQNAMGRRTFFLPVVSALFADFPEGVALLSLNTFEEGNRLRFSIAVPVAMLERGDPVQKLQGLWRQNPSLMKLVKGVRPLTRERTMMNGQAVYMMEFECMLKKAG